MTQSLEDVAAAGPDPFDAPGHQDDGSGPVKGRTPLQLAFVRLRRDRAAMISLAVIILIVLVALFAPVFASITGHGPNDQYHGPNARTLDGLPRPPSSEFWFGTDQQGRDVLVRTVYGARVSLEVGLGATALTMVIGIVLGLLAGYLGTIVDTIISRIIDVVLSVPYLLIAVAVVAVVGNIGPGAIIILIASFGWASVARIIRGQVISLREREFIEAARSLGASDTRIMFVDLLPNVIAPAIVFSTLLVPVSVVTLAALSFLGIGVQPPTADWGGMISDAQQGGLFQIAWWFLVFPSAALLLTTLSFNIFGDGVRDAFDPRSDRLILQKRKRPKKRRRTPGSDTPSTTKSENSFGVGMQR